MNDYFTKPLDTHSWRAIKPDLYGLKFFYANVLRKSWVNRDLIKPPQARFLPDIVTVGEARRLIQATRALRCRVLFFTVYRLGLCLTVGKRRG